MRLNHKKYGEQGEALIILHGLLGSLDNWHTIATELSAQFTVYTLDARNHGRSPHSEEFSYDAMAGDLLEFMKAHQIHSANIIGHSMGGKTAMYFALRHPEKVTRLMVADMSPRAYRSHHDEILESLISFSLNNIRSRTEADEMLAPKIPDWGVRQFLLKNLSRNESGQYEWKMNLPVIHREYANINIEIKTEFPFIKPVLFIRGEQSGYIKEQDVELIKNIFPRAEIVTIPHTGHWVHADAPKEFTRAVFNFLEK